MFSTTQAVKDLASYLQEAAKDPEVMVLVERRSITGTLEHFQGDPTFKELLRDARESLPFSGDNEQRRTRRALHAGMSRAQVKLDEMASASA